MKYRPHLFSLRLGHALRATCVSSAYGRPQLLSDISAGLTVGIIALPLSMALAIASGVAPQHGLYTAMIAGVIIALTGGSRFSVSGPTAAFVVLLLPIAQEYGLGGLLLATMLSGLVLVVMALLRVGRLVQYVPPAVTLGFTSGIALVIAVMQLKDLLGLHGDGDLHGALQQVGWLVTALPDWHSPSAVIGLGTLALLLIWPRLGLRIPPHLPVLALAAAAAWWLQGQGMAVDTLGSRFHYLLPDGSQGQGVPPLLPSLIWPWQQPGADGQPVGLSLQLLTDLIPSALAIAMLGAIESLLCAMVVDGMTGTRHSANSELLGQGLGNLVAPLFGGIPATAAIARSAANVKSGAVSPLSAVVHSAVVLASVVLLADLLSWIPMPAMAALLLTVAWNMSEAPKALRLLRRSPLGDQLVLVCCLVMTVVFDMVVAIGAGLMLASVLFMGELAKMTRLRDLQLSSRMLPEGAPEGWRVLKINGPLFFAAADRIFAEIAAESQGVKGVILYMSSVPVLDAGGLSALERWLEICRSEGTQVVVSDLQYQPLKTLRRAGIGPVPGQLAFVPELSDALKLAVDPG
ncbi:C4-dicarboxylic acid transporter DauA [Ferrimonas sediminicola]|uniref:C4-dicarboxylic acid transporter DauA n=1 Tax=Ferrimonas sediminicola TaxID=2569538 RepID=A0A4U1BGL6_9GAMM|nr:C4-dicarboxylic acid transporter DauA [Ferrimonas sediminicola]TKB50478.1 C4-dicarboxylic acid transporter DauA [Ferrimonas sediminicola]